MILTVIISIIIFILINWGSVALANNINNPNSNGIQCPTNDDFKTLPDIIHDKIPAGNQVYLKSANYGINILFISLLFLIIYGLYTNTNYTLRYIIFITALLSVLMILRNITYSVTTVPPAAKGCKSSTHSFIWNPFLLIKYEENPDAECVDYMFSAHATYALVIFYSIMFTLISQNTFFSWKISKAILTIGTIWILFSISASRLHYTSDVCVAIIIVSLLFYIANNQFLK